MNVRIATIVALGSIWVLVAMVVLMAYGVIP